MATQGEIYQLRIEEIEEKNEDDSFIYASQIVSSFVLCFTLRAAIQLQVLHIIDKAGRDAKLSSPEIAAQMPTKNPEAPKMLDRILRLLASHSVLSCAVVDSERLYGLTLVGRHFLPNEDGVSLAPLLDMGQDKVFLDGWSQLKEAILEGGVPLERALGEKTFGFLEKDHTRNKMFNDAMLNHTMIVTKKILDSYNGFKNIKQLVDVGGGLGITLKLVTSKYPALKGINFDLPHVVQHAPHYPGVEHVGGDMFEHIPKGEAIFLKCVLHNWSDEHCLRVLKNCYNAIPDHGKVIVVEFVPQVMPKTSIAENNKVEVDMIMMMQFHGGKERTQEEFINLASGAGFGGVKFICYVCNLWVMEFYK